MSWLSSWLMNEPATDAANRAANAARSQQQQARSDVKSYLTQGQSAYQNLINYLGGYETKSKSILAKGFASQSDILDQFLNQEESSMVKSIQDTLTEVNRQQSASGLYGGFQNTLKSSPAITDAVQNFLSTALSAKLGLAGEYTQNQLGISNNVLQYLAGAQSGMANLYGSAASGAFGGLNTASQNVVQSAGMYNSSNPFSTILSTLGLGLNAYKTFAGK